MLRICLSIQVRKFVRDICVMKVLNFSSVEKLWNVVFWNNIEIMQEVINVGIMIWVMINWVGFLFSKCMVRLVVRKMNGKLKVFQVVCQLNRVIGNCIRQLLVMMMKMWKVIRLVRVLCQVVGEEVDMCCFFCVMG